MNLRIFFSTLLKTIITGVFIYLGDKDGILTSLGVHKFYSDVAFLQHLLFFLGTAIGLMLIAFPLAKAEVKIKKLESVAYDLLNIVNSSFLAKFQECIKPKDATINIRILVPVYPTIFNLKIKLYSFINTSNKPKITFKVVNLKNMYADIVDEKLTFNVSPIPQGLAGAVYQSKKPIIDFDLYKKDLKVEYNLTDFQKHVTSGLKFCAAFPIFNSNNNVIAIVSIDSKKRLSLKAGKKEILEELIVNFSKILHPQFKRLNES